MMLQSATWTNAWVADFFVCSFEQILFLLPQLCFDQFRHVAVVQAIKKYS